MADDDKSIQDTYNADIDDEFEEVEYLNIVNYMHKGIISLQTALLSPDFDQGIMRYIMIVDHLETHVKARGLITDKYTKDIDDFKKDDKYSKEINPKSKMYYLANKRLELLLALFYQSNTITQPMKLK